MDVDWAACDDLDFQVECTDGSFEEDWVAPAPAAKGVPNSLDYIRKRYRRDVDVDESDDDDDETTLVDSASEDESSDYGNHEPESAFENPPSCNDSMQSFSTVATADIGPLMESPSSEDSLAGSYASDESSLCSSDWLLYPSCDSDRSNSTMQSTSTIASSEIGPLMESPLSEDSLADSCGSEDSSLCSSTWLLGPSCDFDSDGDCSECRSLKKRDVDAEYGREGRKRSLSGNAQRVHWKGS